MPQIAPSPNPLYAVASRTEAGDDFRATVMRVVTNYCTHGAGYETGVIATYVARQPGRDSNRKHSAAVLQALCALEAIGRVRRMDGQTPIVWCKA